MSNTNFYTQMNDLFLNVFLKDKMGLEVDKVKLLSSNDKEGLCSFRVYTPTGIPFIYKKRDAIGRFDNMSFSYEYSPKKNEKPMVIETVERPWQVIMHRCFGNKYYNWHEDELDRRIIELKRKENNLKVGRVLKTSGHNGRKMQEEVRRIQKLRKEITNEIKRLESMRLIVCGKTRQTPTMF